MNLKNALKYVLVGGMIFAIFTAPAQKAIAAVSGEEKQEEQAEEVYVPSVEEIREEARQAEVEQQVQEYIAEATAPVNQTVAGVKSEVGGYYTAKEVQGVAMAPSADSNADKSSFVKVADTDKEKSSAAVAVATTAAVTELSPNAVVGPCINVNYGKMVDGHFTETTDGAKGTLNIGIPANFRTAGANYAIIAVYPRGAYKVFPNSSTDPTKITANIDSSASANVMYALIKY